MKGRKPRNEAFTKEFALRIKHLIGNTPLSKISLKLDKIIGVGTLWDYVNGLSMPRPDVLVKISKEFNVSVDWLLKGEESEIPKDEQEKRLLKYYREAKDLGITDKIESYARFAIEEAKREKNSDQNTTSEAA